MEEITFRTFVHKSNRITIPKLFQVRDVVEVKVIKLLEASVETK